MGSEHRTGLIFSLGICPFSSECDTKPPVGFTGMQEVTVNSQSWGGMALPGSPEELQIRRGTEEQAQGSTTGE